MLESLCLVMTITIVVQMIELQLSVLMLSKADNIYSLYSSTYLFIYLFIFLNIFFFYLDRVVFCRNNLSKKNIFIWVEGSSSWLETVYSSMFLVIDIRLHKKTLFENPEGY